MDCSSKFKELTKTAPLNVFDLTMSGIEPRSSASQLDILIKNLPLGMYRIVLKGLSCLYHLVLSDIRVADHRHLGPRLVLNLITNALKYIVYMSNKNRLDQTSLKYFF